MSGSQPLPKVFHKFIDNQIFRSISSLLYNKSIRPYLPRKLAMCNGVVARRVKLFDSTDYFPNYENVLLGAIRDRVRSSDSVVEIGGGFGVATTVIARSAPDVTVQTFEGSRQHVGYIQETVEMNGVADQVTVTPAVVGTGYDVWGEHAQKYDPSELPDCDVLVMDCEGAESEIVPALEIRPRTAIVVVHPPFGADEDSIRQYFENWGYRTVETRETEGEIPGTLLVFQEK